MRVGFVQILALIYQSNKKNPFTEEIYGNLTGSIVFCFFSLYLVSPLKSGDSCKAFLSLNHGKCDKYLDVGGFASQFNVQIRSMLVMYDNIGEEGQEGGKVTVNSTVAMTLLWALQQYMLSITCDSMTRVFQGIFVFLFIFLNLICMVSISFTYGSLLIFFKVLRFYSSYGGYMMREAHGNNFTILNQFYLISELIIIFIGQLYFILGPSI